MTLPNYLAFGTVTGTFGTVVAGDESQSTGVVIFTPLATVLPMPAETPARTIITTPTRCTIVDGVLTGPDDGAGVQLAAGIQWLAELHINDGDNPPDIVFYVDSGESIDLSDVVSAKAEAGILERTVNAAGVVTFALLNPLLFEIDDALNDLDENLADEITARAAADAGLNTALAAKASSAALGAETTARTNADSAEASTRATADTTNANAITAETAARVALAASLPATYVTRAERGYAAVAAQRPIFTRANGGLPIFTQAAQNPAGGAASPTTSNSIYWPEIVDAKAMFGVGALDEYYMYYSTDHEGTHSNSGVWLATGPTPLGPWTGRGRVYIDNTGGTQTETPSVYADPTGAVAAIMLYQQDTAPSAVGSQTTLYATSNDGITWTRGGIAIDIPSWWPSDGHTGYARPRNFGGKIVAWHLAGGWDYPTFGRSVSYDGRTFWLDRYPLPYQIDLLGDGRRVEWNSGDVIQWSGVWWWIGMASDFVSGASAKDARIIIAPLASDMRSLIGKPTVLLYPTQGTESTNVRALKTFVGRTGILYLYYQCGSQFFVATT